MAKEEGAKTVVVGGKAEIPQKYCGTVGGQSTDFSTIDTEVKVIYPSQLPHTTSASWFVCQHTPNFFCLKPQNEITDTYLFLLYLI